MRSDNVVILPVPGNRVPRRWAPAGRAPGGPDLAAGRRYPRSGAAPRRVRAGDAVPRAVARRDPIRGGAARRPPATCRGRRQHAPVRLTRRGRLVLTVLLMLLATAVGLLASSTGGAEPPPRPVRVQQGDTLWSIANRYAASRDPVAEIEQIRRINHLSGSTIQPGQVLLVPVSS